MITSLESVQQPLTQNRCDRMAEKRFSAVSTQLLVESRHLLTCMSPSPVLEIRFPVASMYSIWLDTLLPLAITFRRVSEMEKQNSFVLISKLVYQQVMIVALLHPKLLVSIPRILFTETIRLRIGGFPARKNSCKTCIMKSSVPRYCGRKHTRHCGLTEKNV